MNWDLAGIAAVLGLVAAALVGDATGLVRCEQHHLGVQAELTLLEEALRAEKARTGQWPASLDAVNQRFSSGAAPKDYWRRSFLYEPGQSIRSLGRDGRPGGIGEDADVIRSLE